MIDFRDGSGGCSRAKGRAEKRCLVEFATDSPMEGDGFEPLVPQREGIGLFETTLIDPWPLHLCEKHLPRRRDLEFAFALLLRGVCEPAQHEGSSRSSTRWL
jgi:hypothetical protein